MKTNWQVILSGLPISSDRGFFGFSSVSLINFKNHLGLFDTGPEGIRGKLLKILSNLNISPGDIEFIILSHLHFDHSINIEMFSNAKIYVSEEELDYALSKEPVKNNDFNYVKPFINSIYKKFNFVKPQTMLYDGKILELPGHTKGSIGFMLEDCIFVGDALKYSSEAIVEKTDYAYYDTYLANKSIKNIINLNKTIIPGHDPAFLITNASVKFVDHTSLEIYKKKTSITVNLTLKET
jgi:glyoxylase-like metal-dependent hydrolase (beta-lactamase superfamily II)